MRHDQGYMEGWYDLRTSAVALLIKEGHPDLAEKIGCIEASIEFFGSKEHEHP
jgi:hypothetical protein